MDIHNAHKTIRCNGKVIFIETRITIYDEKEAPKHGNGKDPS
jgi:hypothetical protein